MHRMNAWWRGEANFLSKVTRGAFRHFPVLGERILDARSRNWTPKIEAYLRSGQTYLAVTGSAHKGGVVGVPALLRARGYKVEQL